MTNKTERDAEHVFFETLVTGDLSGAIMNQEKRGQGEVAHNDVLPRQCPREQLETLGFKFGKDVDDLFIEATLPADWKKVPTSHSMHTELVDDKGRVRGDIFYKAAFYDRSAHMHLDRRYNYGEQPITGWGDGYDPKANCVGVVTDNGKRIWVSERQVKNDDYQGAHDLENEAHAWLVERYPDYLNPLAYWGSERSAAPDGTGANDGD